MEKYLLGLCEKQNHCSYERHDLPYVKKKKLWDAYIVYYKLLWDAVYMSQEIERQWNPRPVSRRLCYTAHIL